MSVGNQYGVICPNCDAGTDLLIRTTADIRLTPHGMEIDDAPLLDSTHVDCLICGWEVTVGDSVRAQQKKVSGSERVQGRLSSSSSLGTLFSVLGLRKAFRQFPPA